MGKLNFRAFLIIFASTVSFTGKANSQICIKENCLNNLANSNGTQNQSPEIIEKKFISKLKIIDQEGISKFNEIFRNDQIELEKIFSNLLLTQDNLTIEDKSENFNYEIESNIQYFEGDIFFAEGNVEILLPNGLFVANKISYDKKNKIFRAYKNINFEKGNQFLKADYLEYNFLISKGYITDVVGVIDYKTLKEDLNVNKALIEEEICEREKVNLNDLPTEVELLSSSNDRYQSLVSLNKLKLNFSEITKWRFKSKKINLEGNKWDSKLIDFTNDPYNTPQIIIRSKNFLGEVKNGKTQLSSSSTSLILDNSVTIPILGRKTINDESGEVRWGIGYEPEDKEGFYILRNFDPIQISETFSLDLQPFFLIERALKGKSNSFREVDSDVLSENSEKNIDFYDYFAMGTQLSGSAFKWDLNVNSYLKTLNYNNFYDAVSADLNLYRNLYSYYKSKDTLSKTECKDNDLSVNQSHDYSLGLGLYSIFDKGDIYTGYGTKLLNTYKFKKQNLNKEYNLIFDYGAYQGKNLNDSKELIGLSRYGLTTSFIHKYKIHDLGEKSINYSNEFKNSPVIIDNGLYIYSKASAGFFEYSNGENQSLTSFTIGPSYTYGNLRRNILDYTKISIFPEFILKSGESPFYFDNFNEDSRIKINLRQQLFGPLILGFEGDYNINASSSKYNSFENQIISLEISRRAYSVSLVYKEYDKSVFLGFDIFNFANSKFNKDF